MNQLICILLASFDFRKCRTSNILFCCFSQIGEQRIDTETGFYLVDERTEVVQYLPIKQQESIASLTALTAYRGDLLYI